MWVVYILSGVLILSTLAAFLYMDAMPPEDGSSGETCGTKKCDSKDCGAC